jgi:hypothetical protein
LIIALDDRRQRSAFAEGRNVSDRAQRPHGGKAYYGG